MITKYSYREKSISVEGVQDFEYEYRGLSTDLKPTGVINGSRFTEIDTGKVFYFDGVSKTWVGGN